MPTALAVVFDTPLDPASALNLANYQLLGPHRLPIPLASAVLAPRDDDGRPPAAGRLNVHWTYTLTVLGTRAGRVRSHGDVYAGTNQVELDHVRNLVRRPGPPGPRRSRARSPRHTASTPCWSQESAHLAASRLSPGPAEPSGADPPDPSRRAGAL